MGIVTPQAMPTYPYGFPDEVIDPFMNRTGRGVLGNRPASGTEIIQELGEEHQRTGKWIVYTSADSVFQIAAHEETVPLEELYDACRVAREILTGKHAVGRVIARPFTGVPGAYERTTNRHDFSLQPRRPNYLSIVRDAGHKVYGVGKIGDIFAHQDVDEEFPTRSNVEGIQKTEELLRTIDDGLVFTNLVETDSLWGHRNDPVNFHRCLQDFDRRLPDILDALRPNDLLILTSDHGCDPTTPSTDHSREYALLLAYVEGRNAAGRIHEEGEFADVGATVNAWLGGTTGAARRSGPADPRAVRPQRPRTRSRAIRRRGGSRARARRSMPRRKGPTRASSRSRRSRRSRPTSVLEVGGGEGELAERIVRELGAELVLVDQSERMVELSRSARSRRAGRPTFSRCRSPTRPSTAPSPPGCSTTPPTSAWRSRSLLASRDPAAGSSPSRTAPAIWPSCASSRRGRLVDRACRSRARTAPSSSQARSQRSRRGTPTVGSSIPDDELIWAYLRSMSRVSPPTELPPHELPLRVQRKPTVFVATSDPSGRADPA